MNQFIYQFFLLSLPPELEQHLYILRLTYVFLCIFMLHTPYFFSFKLLCCWHMKCQTAQHILSRDFFSNSDEIMTIYLPSFKMFSRSWSSLLCWRFNVTRLPLQKSSVLGGNLSRLLWDASRYSWILTNSKQII